jgi:hypothetical protein
MAHLDDKPASESPKVAVTEGDRSGQKVRAVEDLLRLVARLIAKRHLRETLETPISAATLGDQQAAPAVRGSDGCPVTVGSGIKLQGGGVRDGVDLSGQDEGTAQPDTVFAPDLNSVS